MNEELRPCPFCGKENTVAGSTERMILGWWYACEDCFENRKGGVYEDRWNTRPIEDALNARIAELEAERRWIPVSERLPECEKDVLVFWGKASDGSKIDWFGTAWRNECDDGKWCTDPIVPTHWMPLPGMPEAEE